jgi:hypothetical protein
MKKERLTFFVLLLLTVSFACKKKSDDTSAVDTTYDYFPVDIGRTWVYDVDSIVYDDNTGVTKIDTFSYQYKETITAGITDDMGKPAMQLERYFRQNDSDMWHRANSWIISRDNLTAQKVQENIRYVKLVFPLNINKVWDENVYNNTGSNLDSLNYFDGPATVNGQSFPKTLKVIRSEEENIIEEIVKSEIYARNVGLIYLQSDSINTQPIDTLGNTRSRGYRYHLKIRSY